MLRGTWRKYNEVVEKMDVERLLDLSYALFCCSLILVIISRSLVSLEVVMVPKDDDIKMQRANAGYSCSGQNLMDKIAGYNIMALDRTMLLQIARKLLYGQNRALEGPFRLLPRGC